MLEVKENGGIMTETGAPPGPLRVAAVGDIHVREDQTAPMRELFAEVSRNADVLVLAGDLTDHGRVREAEILAEDLRSCSIPVVGVMGNHDHEAGHAVEISEILRKGGLHLLDGDTFELNGVGFAGVKGFAGGFGRRMPCTPLPPIALSWCYIIHRLPVHWRVNRWKSGLFWVPRG
jgi:uncharacterized protein